MAEKKQSTEREYVIPLRRNYMHVARYKRANKAIKTIKEFLIRHMKVRDRDANKIKVDRYLNEYVWFRGIKKPPFKVKVKVKKDGDNVLVSLAELPSKLHFKQLREEKVETKAKAALEKKKTLLEKAKEQTQAKPETKKEETLEDIAEEKEKKESVKESMKDMEKAQAKTAKHTTSAKANQTQRPVRKTLSK